MKNGSVRKVATPGKRTLDVTFPDMWMRALFPHSGIVKPVYIYMVTSAKVSAVSPPVPAIWSFSMGLGIELRVLCMLDKERPLSYISNPKEFKYEC